MSAAAVIGLACRTADSGDLARFWQGLVTADRAAPLRQAKPASESVLDSALADAALNAPAFAPPARAVVLCRSYPAQPAETLRSDRPVATAIELLASGRADLVAAGQQVETGSGPALFVAVLCRAADLEQDEAQIYCLVAQGEADPSGPGGDIILNVDRGRLSLVCLSQPLADRLASTKTSIRLAAAGTPDKCAALYAGGGGLGTGVPALVFAALALFHKVLPAAGIWRESTGLLAGESSPFFQNPTSRPWINPGMRAERKGPRRAVLLDHDGAAARSLELIDCHKDPDRLRTTYLREWLSEILVFAARTPGELVDRLTSLVPRLDGSVPLREIAAATASGAAHSGGLPCRLAIVTGSHSELHAQIQTASRHLLESDAVPLNGENGIFYLCRQGRSEEKLAFMLPGLGAAFPNMLLDLAINFPEVREVFDFIDMVAAEAGDPLVPSRSVFPLPQSAPGWPYANAATLALADSGVMLLIMAEWSLFTLLRALGIEPDGLVGLSTGEFGALCMADVLDVVEAAPTFFKLSTQVARSVPADRLRDLRSLKVSCPFARLSPFLPEAGDPVYLSAETSPSDVIVTGSERAVRLLSQSLDRQAIEHHYLPLAIPYHTPLVSGFVSAEQSEVRSLPVAPAKIPVWSSALASVYPDSADGVLGVATRLFEKPVHFSRTIMKMSEAGFTVFLDIGPRGALLPAIAETLRGRRHTAIATSVPNRAGITQLLYALASLFVRGQSPRLDFLYRRRTSKQAGPLAAQPAAGLSHQPAEPPPAGRALAGAPGGAQAGPVMQSFISSLTVFHSEIMRSSKEVMLAYLRQSRRPDGGQTDSRCLPMMPDAAIAADGQSASVEYELRLDRDLYLLDHAVGGPVSAGGSERVHLLPLMVAVEMMAETASLLAPDMVPTAVRDVRALRRLRVGPPGKALVLTARRAADTSIAVALCEKERPDAPSMSCLVDFARRLPAGTPGESLPDLRAAGQSGADLYGAGGIFHGRRLQAVRAIRREGQASCSALIERRPLDDWFSAGRRQCEPFFHPLLLDSATHLVYFVLKEKSQDLDALLPFHIEAIRLFDAGASGTAAIARARVSGLAGRLTQSTIDIFDQGGRLGARIEGLSHRRIALPASWRDTIAQPRANCGMAAGFRPPPLEIPAELYRFASFDQSGFPEDGAELDWLSDYLLGDSERLIWADEKKTDRRRRDWLSGRLAAKSAVCDLIEATSGVSLGPADVEILPSPEGAPVARLRLPGLQAPLLSISHADGRAVAVAVDAAAGMSVGVDLERARDHDDEFAAQVLSADEMRLLSARSRQEALTALWCAKEAAHKAMSASLRRPPTSLAVTEADRLLEQLAVSSPAGPCARVRIAYAAGWVVAAALSPLPSPIKRV